MAVVIPKGCTAANTFDYPYNKSDTRVLYITYVQGGRTALEFVYDEDQEETENTVTFDDTAHVVSVFLTQEDTLSLKSRVQVEIQIRARVYEGDAVKSDIVTATVDTILKGGVI